MSEEEESALDACQAPNKRTVLERLRRKRISMSCERLRKLLPSFHGRQDDMASILEMTVEYLRLAHEHLAQCQQSTAPNLPVPAELNQGPGDAQLTASMAQPGEEASENTQSTPILFRECKPSGSVQASPKASKVIIVEQRLMPEGATSLEAGATPINLFGDRDPGTLQVTISDATGHLKLPEEPVALLHETGDSSPLLSSTSQRWLTCFSATPEPPSEEDVLPDGLKKLPPGGSNWSCSEPGPQEILHTGAKSWTDEPEFKLEAKGKPSSGATGVLPQPEWMPWMLDQEMLLPELSPARTPGCQMLFEDQATAAWDLKSSLHYGATSEEMETGNLEMYGLLALNKELEP